MNTFILDLQLFAVQVTTQASLSDEMKTFYDKTLIDEAGPNLIHHQFGQVRNIPANGGKKIEFRKFAPLNKALTPLTEGVTPAGNSLSVSKIEAEVSQYGDFITQSDVLEMTAIDNTIVEATKLLGRQAGLTLDTVDRNVMQSGTNVSYCNAGTKEVRHRADLTSESRMSVNMVNKIVAKLRGQNTPTINGKYVCIIHPYVAYDLMEDERWIDANKYSNATKLFEGEVGEIGGMRFVQTSEALVLGDKKVGFKINNGSGYTGAITSVAFDGVSVAADELKGQAIIINGVGAKITGNTTTSISFESTDFGAISDNTDFRVAASKGGSVFCSLALGDGAYGVTSIEGGNLQTMVKQKGSAGTADPLDQRSSVGWKAMATAELLIPNYIVRIESCSPDFANTASN